MADDKQQKPDLKAIDKKKEEKVPLSELLDHPFTDRFHRKLVHYLRLRKYRSSSGGVCYGMLHDLGFTYLIDEQHFNTRMKRLKLIDRYVGDLTEDTLTDETELTPKVAQVQEKMRQGALLARLKWWGKNKNKWCFLDVNNLEWVKDKCNSNEVAQLIPVISDKSSWNNFHVQVLVKDSKNHRQNVAAAMADWHAREDIRKLHEITPKKAKQVTSRGDSLLYTAAAHGDVETLEKLLKLGADPNLADNDAQWTPLHRAVLKRHVVVIERLLALEEIKILQKDKDGKTALDWAIKDNSIEIIRMLVRKMENERQQKNDPDLLMWAVRRKQVKVIRILLEKREGKALDDSALLGWAIQNQHVNLVEILLEKGTKVSVPLPPEGQTALHLAVSVENIPILEQLLRQEIKERRVRGLAFSYETKESPLHLAVRTGKIEAVKTLLSSALYSSVCARHVEEGALWDLAIRNKSIEIIRRLVNHEALKDGKNNKVLKNDDELLLG